MTEKEKGSLLTEGGLIASAPVLAYLAVYKFEQGYLSYFGISSLFVNINQSVVANSLVFILSYIFIFTMFVAFYFSLMGKKEVIKNKIFHSLILYSLFINFPCLLLGKYTYFGISFAIGFCIYMYSQLKDHKKRALEISASESIKEEISVTDIFVSGFGLKGFFFLWFFLLVLPLASQNLGELNAKYSKDLHLGNKRVVRIYEGYILEINNKKEVSLISRGEKNFSFKKNEN